MTARRVLLLLVFLAVASAVFGQITITSTSPLPQGFSTLPYTYTFTAFSFLPDLPVSFSLTPGSTLPTGFTLASNGTLSGTTNQFGNFSFQVTATNGSSSATATFALTLLIPFITINSPPFLPNGFVGQTYSLLFSGSSNPAGLTWTLGSGSLPPGLFLNPSGLLTGNPTTAGVYSFIMNVQISGTTLSTNQSFTLTIYSGQTSIQTTSLPLAFSGKPYSTLLSATPSAVTWGLTGMLPPGITFNPATGLFSGMTTTTGIYSLLLQANYPNYVSSTTTLILYVTSGPLTVPQTNLAPAVEGSPYQAPVLATGGLPPYQWSIAATNTQGLSIGAQTGIISGTPTTSGILILPVILTDATGQSTTIAISVFVATPLSVSTTSLPNASAGSPYSQSLLAGGGVSPFTWTVTSGSLPPGLTLSTTGVISGTPSGTGTYHFTVQVTDAGGRTATGSLSISLGVAALSITTSSLPNGQLTVPYSQTLAVSGGVAPYSWALVSGALPPGLSLLPSGKLSGTPLGPLGITTFAVQVTDSSPPPALTAQKAFTINVALTLTITTIGPLPGGVVNVPYSQTLAGSGGTPPYIWNVTSGALPPGLSLNTSTGAVSGTPTATGPNLFTVTLQDATGLTAQQQLSIAIAASANPPSITTSNLSATVGTAFSQTLAATGGTPPYTWSISSGTLPAGLLFSGGVISGTPTAAGTSNITLKVTDSQQLSATASISITVGLPSTPALTIGTIPATPATQPAVSLSLASSFPVALTGTISVSFQSAVGGSPTEVTFFTSAGSFTSLTFNIPAGSTTAVFPNPPVLDTGTVAGTITLSATLSSGGVVVTPTPATENIVIPSSAPVIQKVTFSNTGGTLAVIVTGYSTTREMVSGQFTFAPASGSTLSQSTITEQLSSAFSTWYSSSASNQWGGQFMLTAPFSVAGDAADVSSVSVTLTNTKGASAAVTPQ